MAVVTPAVMRLAELVKADLGSVEKVRVGHREKGEGVSEMPPLS